jgi:hypothetical protein
MLNVPLTLSSFSGPVESRSEKEKDCPNHPVIPSHENQGNINIISHKAPTNNFTNDIINNNLINNENHNIMEDIDNLLRQERNKFEHTNSINNHNNIIIDPQTTHTHNSLTSTFPLLSFATHNINGIKSNIYKLHLLIHALPNVDIIGLNETNIKYTQGIFINQELKDSTIFWSKHNKNKLKGKGVAVYVKNK